jgi:hypothetical protein
LIHDNIGIHQLANEYCTGACNNIWRINSVEYYLKKGEKKTDRKNKEKINLGYLLQSFVSKTRILKLTKGDKCSYIGPIFFCD